MGISPVFQKGNTADKSNHRPISTFSDFSKISGKLSFTQIN